MINKNLEKLRAKKMAEKRIKKIIWRQKRLKKKKIRKIKRIQKIKRKRALKLLRSKSRLRDKLPKAFPGDIYVQRIRDDQFKKAKRYLIKSTLLQHCDDEMPKISIPTFTHFVHKPSLNEKQLENVLPLIKKKKVVKVDDYLKTLVKSIEVKN